MFLNRKQQTAQEFISGCLFLERSLFQIFGALSKDNPGDKSGTSQQSFVLPAAAANPFPTPGSQHRRTAHMYSGAASACHRKEKGICPQVRPSPLSMAAHLNEIKKKRETTSEPKKLSVHRLSPAASDGSTRSEENGAKQPRLAHASPACPMAQQPSSTCNGRDPTQGRRADRRRKLSAGRGKTAPSPHK